MPLKRVFVIMRCYYHNHALDIMLPPDQEGHNIARTLDIMLPPNQEGHNIARIMFQATGSSCFVNISPATN